MISAYQFNQWAAKAPVLLSNAAWLDTVYADQVSVVLTPEERTSVRTALWHAVLDGRTEFDKVTSRIRKRLYAGQKPKRYKNDASWAGATG